MIPNIPHSSSIWSHESLLWFFVILVNISCDYGLTQLWHDVSMFIRAIRLPKHERNIFQNFSFHDPSPWSSPKNRNSEIELQMQRQQSYIWCFSCVRVGRVECECDILYWLGHHRTYSQLCCGPIVIGTWSSTFTAVTIASDNVIYMINLPYRFSVYEISVTHT